MAKKQLQEMDVAAGTKQSKTAVNANAKPAMPMDTSVAGSVEDLGGPTPMNYKPDDDSAKLKTPGATLKQVKDVVNKGAKPAEGSKSLKKEEEEKPADQVVSEEETTEEEVVAEEETAEVEETQEVVAEEEATEEEVVEEKIDVDADINALIEGEKLSEEFEAKARTIFESAIKAKVAELSEQVKISYEEKLVEEVSEIKKELQERVDSYLEYVASEWLEENQLAAEAGLKTEMTESFLEGMKSLFEEHYVTIPEDKYDVLNSMVDKLDEMENKLNEQIKSNVALNRRLAESVADVIFAEVTEGLADTQRDKLASLAENVEFESEEDYREKLVTLRESYFPSKSGTQRDKSENLSEGDEASTPQPVSGLMESYLQTMSRVSKK